MSGLVSPDSWTLDRAGAVIEASLGAKERMVVYDAGGGAVERPVPEDLVGHLLREVLDLGATGRLGRDR